MTTTTFMFFHGDTRIAGRMHRNTTDLTERRDEGTQIDFYDQPEQLDLVVQTADDLFRANLAG